MTWACLAPVLAFVIPAAAGIYAAYEFGLYRGLFRSREIEDRIDGPVDWDTIRRVKRAMNTEGWFV